MFRWRCECAYRARPRFRCGNAQLDRWLNEEEESEEVVVVVVKNSNIQHTTFICTCISHTKHNARRSLARRRCRCREERVAFIVVLPATIRATTKPNPTNLRRGCKPVSGVKHTLVVRRTLYWDWARGTGTTTRRSGSKPKSHLCVLCMALSMCNYYN